MIESLVFASVPVLLFSGFVCISASARSAVVFSSSRLEDKQVYSHFSCQRSRSEALVMFPD